MSADQYWDELSGGVVDSPDGSSQDSGGSDSTYTPDEDRDVTAEEFREVGLDRMADRVEEGQEGYELVEDIGLTEAADRAAALRAIGFTDEQLRDMGDYGGPTEDPVGWTVGGIQTGLDDNPIHDQFDSEAGDGFADITSETAADARQGAADAAGDIAGAVSGPLRILLVLVALFLVVESGVLDGSEG